MIADNIAGIQANEVTVEFVVTRRLLEEVERALTEVGVVQFGVRVGSNHTDRISKAKSVKTALSNTTALTLVTQTSFPNITASSVSVSYKVTARVEVETTKVIDLSTLDKAVSDDLGGLAKTTSFGGLPDPAPAPSGKTSTNGSPQSSGYIFTAFMVVVALITKTLV